MSPTSGLSHHDIFTHIGVGGGLGVYVGGTLVAVGISVGEGKVTVGAGGSEAVGGAGVSLGVLVGFGVSVALGVRVGLVVIVGLGVRAGSNPALRIVLSIAPHTEQHPQQREQRTMGIKSIGMLTLRFSPTEMSTLRLRKLIAVPLLYKQP